jgi:hypothetical protein
MNDFVLRYWLEIVFGIIVAVLTGIYRCAYRKVLKRLAENDAVKNGVQALLRDRIVQTYNHYQEREECPIYALENAESLYKEYHALGGNGTITRLMEELRNLPRAKRDM